MRQRVLIATVFVLPLAFAADASAQSLRAQAEAYAQQGARSNQDKDRAGSDDPAVPAPEPRSPVGSIVMHALYGSAVVVHGLDAHSTFAALDAGAIEVNPVLEPLTRHRAPFIAFKAGVAAGTIYAAHHMAKRNKVAAALTLLAVNSVYAVIAANNYRVAREMRAAQTR